MKTTNIFSSRKEARGSLALTKSLTQVCRATLVVALSLLTLSCEEETPKDYRDGWLGSYTYSGEKSSWYIDTEEHNRAISGVLTVNALDDSSITIQLYDTYLDTINCRVDADGILTLIGNQYRFFSGKFFDEDSLYLRCANYSPGAGSETTLSCKRRY